MVTLRELLEQMVQMGASDLHLTVGSPPIVRVDGKLVKTNHDMLTAEHIKKIHAE
jgi:twitching motility protein PilT